MLVLSLLVTMPRVALADADEAMPPGMLRTQVGLQPLRAPLAAATPYPGESRVIGRPDGAYDAVPEIRGRVKLYRLVARNAPWTLRPGLTVMAKT
jgi:hypothetical protein